MSSLYLEATNCLHLEAANYLRPPAPTARVEPLGFFELLKVLWNNPIEAWTQEHFDQPIVINELTFGEVAVVSEPRAIRRVLNENAGNYRKDFFQRRMLSFLENGLLAAEGEQWRAQRRTLAPIFAGRSVRKFAPAMLAAIDAMVQQWRRRRDGDVVDVAAEVTLLALDVLERTIFSDGLGRDAEDVRAAMRIYFDQVGRIDPFDVLGLPDFVPRLGRLSAGPAFRVFDHAVDAMIATRRRRLDEKPGGVPRDVLTLLLEAQDPVTGRGMSEPEIRANIFSFMAAGHESTANAITWALFLLSLSDEWRERVVAEGEGEIGGPAETLPDRLIDTRAVIDEAIRLYPPLAALSRAAVAPDELAGRRIRAKAIVVIAPYVLHRHRRLWERPDVFDPNRFLDGGRERLDRYAYLPFGAGPRACIASLFAVQEAMLAVASIMKNFELDVAPGHTVWPVHRITLRPRGGLPMVIHKRGGAGPRREAAGPARLALSEL